MKTSLKMVLALGLAFGSNQAMAIDFSAVVSAVGPLIDFIGKFQGNVDDVKAKLAEATIALRNGGNALQATIKELKATKDPVAQEKLIPKINTEIVTMFEKFNAFINSTGMKFLVPVMEIFEKLPEIGPKMKIGKNNTPISNLAKDNFDLISQVVKVQKALLPKLNAIVEEAAEAKEEQIAEGTAPAAATAPITFDDL